MELRRGISGKDLLWQVRGNIDDDSFLELETMVMNSGYSGEDLIIDLSDVGSISNSGRRSIDMIVRSAKDRGASVRILKPDSI
jgi:anti-anti-sigma regulatory factor